MSIFRSVEDTSIGNDRSSGDRRRHREKVRQAIKENIPHIVSEEAIIGQSGDKKIKVPIKGIKEYRFVFGSNNPGASHGSGEEKVGDVIPGGSRPKPGPGQPGSDPGEDIYETEISMEELMELLFEDLALPDLERKRLQYLEAERLLKKKGYKPEGIRPRLSKRESMKRRIRRKQMSNRLSKELKEKMSEQENMDENENDDFDGGELGINKTDHRVKRFPFHQDDLRYSRIKPEIKRFSNAVIFCIMDTSGSMDMMKKYYARSFYFLLYSFVKTRYQNVDLVFIAHHTEAKEVSEEEFFHKGESGGTKISSGYKKALEIIEKRYLPSLWNIYAFHCSDGDNFSEDNDDAVKSAQKLADVSNLFGYGEIKPQGSYSWSSMLDLYNKSIKAINFITVKIHEKLDIWNAFQAFMRKEKMKE